MPPQPEHLVLPPRRGSRPDRGPVHGEHLVRVPWQVQLQLPRPRAPHLERAVFAPANHHPAVRAPRDLIHRSDVPAHRRDELPGLPVPQLHRLIERRAGDELRVRGEHDVVDELHVARHASRRGLARLRRPQKHREVVRAADEPFRLPGHRDIVTLPRHTFPLLIVRGRDRLVIERAGARRVLVGQRERVHPVPVPFQLPHHLPVLRVPAYYRRVPGRGVYQPLAAPLQRRHDVRVRGQREQTAFMRHVPEVRVTRTKKQSDTHTPE
mmetsp:Transcript_13945/g.50063  ORF Transcript_13945/g.50063 Transcript_13945/m.50063 type:complete len:267 (+) Transcript_13945:670-1470(+)